MNNNQIKQNEKIKILKGMVKSKSDDFKELSGITLILIKSSGVRKESYVILGGATEEDHKRLTEILYNQTDDFLGFNSLDEFREAWKEGMDGCFYIPFDEIEVVEEQIVTACQK